MKAYARRLMQKTDTPVRLWCFCYEYCADVLGLCATGRFDLQGRTPYEGVMNYTPDISEYASYSWFQWCWFHYEKTKSKRLCRWLGPTHSKSQAISSYILLDSGDFIARSSVLGIPEEDLLPNDMLSSCKKFMTMLKPG